MEHIVQFAIGIDDEAIKKRIQESGYDDIIKSLTKDMKEQLSQGPYANKKWGSSEITIDWKTVVDYNVEKFLEENREVIIEKAAEKLAESYRKTKKFKEHMEKALEEE